MSLNLKFAVFTSLLCIMIIAGITWLAYILAYRELETHLGEKLQAIASTAALGIDGDRHDSIRATKDNYMEIHQQEPFTTIREHLREVKAVNDLKQELYTFRREGGKLHYVVMTHERSYVDTYDIKPDMLPTLNDGKPSFTGVYGDENGHWISGYGPIRDQGGAVVGLLEVDYRVDEFMALLKAKYRPLILKALVFAVLAVIGSFLLAKTVTRRLNYLTDITEKISLGKMDQPIEVKGSDEVAKLGTSLERMRESLKIAAELIG